MSYPEHEKLSKVSDESQTIGTFLDLSGYTLCKWVEQDACDDDACVAGGFVPDPGSIQRILADYFDIDLTIIEREKRAMLAAHRIADDRESWAEKGKRHA